MEILQSPLMLLLLPTGAALAWAACRWWYGRQIQKLEQRIAKLQADRETLHEQVKKARHQLGQVQKDMATWRTAVASAQRPAASDTAPEAAAPAATAKPPARSLSEIAAGLVFEEPQRPAHGFADTQPFDTDAVA